MGAGIIDGVLILELSVGKLGGTTVERRGGKLLIEGILIGLLTGDLEYPCIV
jgi:hypothetical protein